MSEKEDVKNLVDSLLSEAAGGETKKAKKSKKELSREKIVREVRARQQKGKGSSNEGGKGNGGNGSKDSSSEEEDPKKTAAKSENSDSNKEKSGAVGRPLSADKDNTRTKTVVKISTKRMSSKPGEHSPATEKKESSKEETRCLGNVAEYGSEEPEVHKEGRTVVLGRFLSFHMFLQKYEEAKGLENPGPPRFSYSIVLRCMDRNSEETKEVKMWTTPKTGADIKVGFIFLWICYQDGGIGN